MYSSFNDDLYHFIYIKKEEKKEKHLNWSFNPIQFKHLFKWRGGEFNLPGLPSCVAQLDHQTKHFKYIYPMSYRLSMIV